MISFFEMELTLLLFFGDCDVVDDHLPQNFFLLEEARLTSFEKKLHAVLESCAKPSP